MILRRAVPADCPRLVAIYAPFVRDTAVSFAEAAPEEADFLHKMAGQYPFYVMEENGLVIGYAYAGAYRAREAYRWGVEVSIYVDPNAHGRGIGKQLMTALLGALARQGYQAAYACITLPNEKSVGLHERMGFRTLGVFDHAGYKLGQWHSVVWMQRDLGDFPTPPREPLPFRDLPEESSHG